MARKRRPLTQSGGLWRRRRPENVCILSSLISGFMSTCISILSTWTGRAKKLDEVQFSILPGWKQRMVRTMGHDGAKQNTPRGDRRHRHKLRETSKNVPESKMKDLMISKLKRLVYTNHCLRATAITLWSDAGLSMTLSGHRNENSLHICSSKRSLICPESTSHTSRSENASLPWEPAATTSTI